jgi:hypothetical protein
MAAVNTRVFRLGAREGFFQRDSDKRKPAVNKLPADPRSPTSIRNLTQREIVAVLSRSRARTLLKRVPVHRPKRLRSGTGVPSVKRMYFDLFTGETPMSRRVPLTVVRLQMRSVPLVSTLGSSPRNVASRSDPVAKIVKVELGRFDYATAGEFKFFKPGPDGRSMRPSIIVRLTDENGCEGWGQSVPSVLWTYETVETVLTTLEFHLAGVVLGRDPADFAGLHAAMNAAIRPAFSVGQPLCKAALDLACFDLVGKQRGVPAWQLFG